MFSAGKCDEVQQGKGSCRQQKTGTNLEHPPVAKVSLPHIAGDSIMEISEKRQRGQSGQVHPQLITRTPLKLTQSK